MTLFTVLAWSLPTVIALATLEGLILTFVVRRAYDWRSWAASATDALVREYLVYAFVTVSLVGPLIEMTEQSGQGAIGGPIDVDADFALIARVIDEEEGAARRRRVPRFLQRSR